MSIYGETSTDGDASLTATASNKPAGLVKVLDPLGEHLPTVASKLCAAIAVILALVLVFQDTCQDAPTSSPASSNWMVSAPQQLKCQLESTVPSQCEECFVPFSGHEAGDEAHCVSNTCHNDGHWVELDEVEDSNICDCQSHCLGLAGATAFQFNDDGWCGCLMVEGTTFDSAVGSRQHIHPEETECALCNVEHLAGWQDPMTCVDEGDEQYAPICVQNTCHNDGHWQEVAIIENVAGMCDCAEQCIIHPTATAYQFNTDGFCGCLEIANADFNSAIAGPHIHPTETACTICTIEHVQDTMSSGALHCQLHAGEADLENPYQPIRHPPSACAECFVPFTTNGDTVECTTNTCHNDGHWQEVAELEDVADMCACQAECIADPRATAFQYNDDGWCGCLVVAGTSFGAAISSAAFTETGECAICNIEHLQGWQDVTQCQIGTSFNTPICAQNTCHNDGNFVEVDTPHAAGVCDCATQCTEHPTATAFQFNAEGFCGCLEIQGTDFNNAINGPYIHEATSCTLCDIQHMANDVASQCPAGMTCQFNG